MAVQTVAAPLDGARLGALLGHRPTKHAEEQPDIELDECVLDNASAAVIVSDDKHLYRAETTLGNSSKRIN